MADTNVSHRTSPLKRYISGQKESFSGNFWEEREDVITVEGENVATKEEGEED